MKADKDKSQKPKRSAPKYWVEISGKLYARLQYKTGNGQYRVKYKPISDKRTARSVVAGMRSELETHGEEVFLAEKMTFDELADKYEVAELVEATYQDGIKIRGRRSISSVRSAIKPLRAYFGRKAASSIKPADLKIYKDLRLSTLVETEVNLKREVTDIKTGKKKKVVEKVIRTRQRKVASVNRELASLRAILNFAINNDWLVRNPFTRSKGIISMSSEVERDRVLSFAEEERLLAACVNERAHVKPLLVCALDTAMRRGEIFKMIWNDVNFSTGEIHIPQTNTKTEEARKVAMTPRLRQILEQLWDVSPKDQSRIVFGITDNINKSWLSACAEAQVEGFRFHDCRHTATTRMIASGSPHTEVMKITGHSQLKTFLRYLTITTESANRVASRLSDYVIERQIMIDDVSEYVN